MRVLAFIGAVVGAGAVVQAAVVPTHSEPLLLKRQNATSTNTTEALPPSQDPWYDAPAALNRKPNGAVLKARNVSTAFDTFSTAYQLLYKTTDAQGEPDATNTLVFAPLEPLSPPQILLYMAPADTAAIDCSVQYALLSNTESNITSSSSSISLLIALSKGYYVSLPDHEGSKAAFISGVTEARAGLDGLRALLNFKTALPSSDGYKAVIFGYSGGGHAAAWATQYLTSYGKGLNVVGASFGGVPVDLYYTFDLLSATNNTNLGFSAMAGLANAEPALNRWLLSNLYANGTDAIAYARSNEYCLDSIPNATYPWAGADFYTFFKGGEMALHKGLPARYLGQEELGIATPDGNKGVLPSIPVFMFHSKTDEVVSYGPIRPYYLAQCQKGAKIHLATTTGSEHSTTFINYLGDSFLFIERAFNGTTGVNSCSSSDGVELELLSPGYIQAVGALAATQLLQLSGAARMRV
ncbi:hypothetical protein JCM6882_000186 [Rhodosporidiobolus microsporus]